MVFNSTSGGPDFIQKTFTCMSFYISQTWVQPAAAKGSRTKSYFSLFTFNPGSHLNSVPTEWCSTVARTETRHQDFNVRHSIVWEKVRRSAWRSRFRRSLESVNTIEYWEEMLNPLSSQLVTSGRLSRPLVFYLDPWGTLTWNHSWVQEETLSWLSWRHFTTRP